MGGAEKLWTKSSENEKGVGNNENQNRYKPGMSWANLEMAVHKLLATL